MPEAEKSIKPFVISALISGMAMGLLWFYFDWFYSADLFIKMHPLWQRTEKISLSFFYWFHWSLPFVLIPPVAMWISLKPYIQRGQIKSLFMGIGFVALWLFCFWAYSDFQLALPTFGRSSLTKPYLSNYAVIPLISVTQAS
jgi:hypothetical protein